MLDGTNRIVLDLLESRLKLGQDKYNQDIPLNGEGNRDNFDESIEEALDMTIYLAAALLEKKMWRDRYKKAFHVCMEHWNKLPYDIQNEINKKLEELNL